MSPVRRKVRSDKWTDEQTLSPVAVQRQKLRATIRGKLAALRAAAAATPGGVSGLLVAFAVETASYLDTKTGRVVLGTILLTLAWPLL